MLKSIDTLLAKELFTIKDLAYILDKQTQTIRKWEKKGVISKCGNYGSNGWRQYNRLEFANILEEILNYPWERNTIFNAGQIQLVINYLKAN
jgi:DNA-binding transcriptional MerR regulator